MIPTINWKYNNFCAYSAYGDKVDVVYCYSWECTASVNGSVLASRVGTVNLNLQNPNFIFTYGDLTEQAVTLITKQIISTHNVVNEVTNEALIKLGVALQPRPAPWEQSN